MSAASAESCREVCERVTVYVSPLVKVSLLASHHHLYVQARRTDTQTLIIRTFLSLASQVLRIVQMHTRFIHKSPTCAAPLWLPHANARASARTTRAQLTPAGCAHYSERTSGPTAIGDIGHIGAYSSATDGVAHRGHCCSPLMKTGCALSS